MADGTEQEVDQARKKLLEIAMLIRELEGLPVDFGLARRLAVALRYIEGSV